MTTLTALVLSLAPFGAPRAYPIPPVPLRRLVAEAEFIVKAQVRKAEDREKAAVEGETPYCPMFVALDIEQILKGRLGLGTIVVPNELGMICPAPARYEVGTRVLAFLYRTERGDFRTHALSYGAKTLDPAGLAVYLKRIEEQFAIERIPEGPGRLAAQVEWLVTCAEHSATRWEGAYEFTTEVEPERRRHYGVPTRFARELSDAQRERLRAAYLSAEAFDQGTRLLERFFRNDEDPRFLEWQVKRLRAVHQEVEKSGYGEAASLVGCIGYRDGRPRVRELAETFASKSRFGTPDDDGPGRLLVVQKLLAMYP